MTGRPDERGPEIVQDCEGGDLSGEQRWLDELGGGQELLVVAAPDGPMLAPIVELAGDLAARGARVLAIGGDTSLAAASSYHVPGPDLPEPVAPIGLIVPAQLVVESLARRLGLDPDAPGGLSKVTATDPS